MAVPNPALLKMLPKPIRDMIAKSSPPPKKQAVVGPPAPPKKSSSAAKAAVSAAKAGAKAGSSGGRRSGGGGGGGGSSAPAPSSSKQKAEEAQKLIKEKLSKTPSGQNLLRILEKKKTSAPTTKTVGPVAPTKPTPTQQQKMQEIFAKSPLSKTPVGQKMLQQMQKTQPTTPVKTKPKPGKPESTKPMVGPVAPTAVEKLLSQKGGKSAELAKTLYQTRIKKMQKTVTPSKPIGGTTETTVTSKEPDIPAVSSQPGITTANTAFLSFLGSTQLGQNLMKNMTPDERKMFQSGNIAGALASVKQRTDEAKVMGPRLPTKEETYNILKEQTKDYDVDTSSTTFQSTVDSYMPSDEKIKADVKKVLYDAGYTSQNFGLYNKQGIEIDGQKIGAHPGGSWTYSDFVNEVAKYQKNQIRDNISNQVATQQKMIEYGDANLVKDYFGIDVETKREQSAETKNYLSNLKNQLGYDFTKDFNRISKEATSNEDFTQKWNTFFQQKLLDPSLDDTKVKNYVKSNATIKDPETGKKITGWQLESKYGFQFVRNKDGTVTTKPMTEGEYINYLKRDMEARTDGDWRKGGLLITTAIIKGNLGLNAVIDTLFTAPDANAMVKGYYKWGKDKGYSIEELGKNKDLMKEYETKVHTTTHTEPYISPTTIYAPEESTAEKPPGMSDEVWESIQSGAPAAGQYMGYQHGTVDPTYIQQKQITESGGTLTQKPSKAKVEKEANRLETYLVAGTDVAYQNVLKDEANLAASLRKGLGDYVWNVVTSDTLVNFVYVPLATAGLAKGAKYVGKLAIAAPETITGFGGQVVKPLTAKIVKGGAKLTMGGMKYVAAPAMIGMGAYDISQKIPERKVMVKGPQGLYHMETVGGASALAKGLIPYATGIGGAYWGAKYRAFSPQEIARVKTFGQNLKGSYGRLKFRAMQKFPTLKAGLTKIKPYTPRFMHPDVSYATYGQKIKPVSRGTFGWRKGGYFDTGKVEYISAKGKVPRTLGSKVTIEEVPTSSGRLKVTEMTKRQFGLEQGFIKPIMPPPGTRVKIWRPSQEPKWLTGKEPAPPVEIMEWKPSGPKGRLPGLKRPVLVEPGKFGRLKVDLQTKFPKQYKAIQSTARGFKGKVSIIEPEVPPYLKNIPKEVRPYATYQAQYGKYLPSRQPFVGGGEPTMLPEQKMRAQFERPWEKIRFMGDKPAKISMAGVRDMPAHKPMGMYGLPERGMGYPLSQRGQFITEGAKVRLKTPRQIKAQQIINDSRFWATEPRGIGSEIRMSQDLTPARRGLIQDIISANRYENLYGVPGTSKGWQTRIIQYQRQGMPISEWYKYQYAKSQLQPGQKTLVDKFGKPTAYKPPKVKVKADYWLEPGRRQILEPKTFIEEKPSKLTMRDILPEQIKSGEAIIAATKAPTITGTKGKITPTKGKFWISPKGPSRAGLTTLLEEPTKVTKPVQPKTKTPDTKTFNVNVLKETFYSGEQWTEKVKIKALNKQQAVKFAKQQFPNAEKILKVTQLTKPITKPTTKLDYDKSMKLLPPPYSLFRPPKPKFKQKFEYKPPEKIQEKIVEPRHIKIEKQIQKTKLNVKKLDKQIKIRTNKVKQLKEQVPAEEYKYMRDELKYEVKQIKTQKQKLDEQVKKLQKEYDWVKPLTAEERKIETEKTEKILKRRKAKYQKEQKFIKEQIKKIQDMSPEQLKRKMAKDPDFAEFVKWYVPTLREWQSPIRKVKIRAVTKKGKRRLIKSEDMWWRAKEEARIKRIEEERPIKEYIKKLEEERALTKWQQKNEKMLKAKAEEYLTKLDNINQANLRQGKISKRQYDARKRVIHKQWDIVKGKAELEQISKLMEKSAKLKPKGKPLRPGADFVTGSKVWRTAEELRGLRGIERWESMQKAFKEARKESKVIKVKTPEEIIKQYEKMQRLKRIKEEVEDYRRKMKITEAEKKRLDQLKKDVEKGIKQEQGIIIDMLKANKKMIIDAVTEYAEPLDVEKLKADKLDEESLIGLIEGLKYYHLPRGYMHKTVRARKAGKYLPADRGARPGGYVKPKVRKTLKDIAEEPKEVEIKLTQEKLKDRIGYASSGDTKQALVTQTKQTKVKADTLTKEINILDKNLKKHIDKINKFRQRLYKESQTKLLPAWQQQKLQKWIERLRQQTIRMDRELIIKKDLLLEIDKIRKQTTAAGNKIPKLKKTVASEQLLKQIQRQGIKSEVKLNNVVISVQKLKQLQKQGQKVVSILAKAQKQAQAQKVALSTVLVQLQIPGFKFDIALDQFQVPKLQLVQEAVPEEPITEPTPPSRLPARRRVSRERKTMPTPFKIPLPEEKEREKKHISYEEWLAKKYKRRKFLLPTFTGALEESQMRHQVKRPKEQMFHKLPSEPSTVRTPYHIKTRMLKPKMYDYKQKSDKKYRPKMLKL